MTNVNYAAEELYPQAGADNKKRVLALVDSQAKAAKDDTWTITNASAVQILSLVDDTTGGAESHTVSTNVITMTSATTGAKSAVLLITKA